MSDTFCKQRCGTKCRYSDFTSLHTIMNVHNPDSSGEAWTPGCSMVEAVSEELGGSSSHVVASKPQEAGLAPTSSYSTPARRLMAASTPHVLLQQYWLNSLLLILLSTRRSVRASTPSCMSCSLVICRNRARSPASHSKVH